MQQNYYEILEISESAAPHEIRDAYQRLRSAYSPDSAALYSMFTEDEARELTAIIHEAYETLSSPIRRQAYDKSLLTQPGQRPSQPSSHLASTRPVEFSENEQAQGGKTSLGSYEIQNEMETYISEARTIDGSFLKKVREYKNISTVQMVDEIRISKSYLKAIEENDMQKLPARVFVRGFVSQICKSLGLEIDRYLPLYMEFYRRENSQSTKAQ